MWFCVVILIHFDSLWSVKLWFQKVSMVFLLKNVKYAKKSKTEAGIVVSVIIEEVEGVQSYLLAEVERWDIGLVNVIRHSISSPARNTGPRAMEATTSIICINRKKTTVIKFTKADWNPKDVNCSWNVYKPEAITLHTNVSYNHECVLVRLQTEVNLFGAAW